MAALSAARTARSRTADDEALSIGGEAVMLAAGRIARHRCRAVDAFARSRGRGHRLQR